MFNGKLSWLTLTLISLFIIQCKVFQNKRDFADRDQAVVDTSETAEQLEDPRIFKASAAALDESQASSNCTTDQTPLASPLGIGTGGGIPQEFEAQLDWWHNWGVSHFTRSAENSRARCDLPPNRFGMFPGGPVPSQFPRDVWVGRDGEEVHYTIENQILPPVYDNNLKQFVYTGEIYLYCQNAPHLCHLTKELCKQASNNSDKCDTRAFFRHGRRYMPGCANEVHDILKVRNENGDLVVFRHPECTEADLKGLVEPYLQVLKVNAKGRSWQIFNEPDDGDQSWLTPKGAAQVYNYFYPRAKKIDPTARFYCCGTHPGLSASGDIERRSWMAEFRSHLEYPLDGIHYHNYYNKGSWSNTEGILREMKYFSEEVHNMNSDGRPNPPLLPPKTLNYGLFNGEQKFSELPIVITEWSALRGLNTHNLQWRDYFLCNPEQKTFRQIGYTCRPENPGCDVDWVVPDNLAQVMRPVMDWYMDSGRKKFNHIGMAWFVSQTDANATYGLLLREGSNVSTTCLWDEYKTLPSRNDKNKPTITRKANEDACSFINVSLPSQDWGPKHRKNAVLYDGETFKPLMRLIHVTTDLPNGCSDSLYWNGNSNYPDSYYRYYIKESELQNNLICHPNLTSSKLAIRFEFENGVPYSDFSNTMTFSAPSSSGCYRNYIPAAFARATGGLLGDGWKNGMQIQNIGDQATHINTFLVEPYGGLTKCGKSRWIEAGASTTYLTDRASDCPVPGNKGFAGGVLVTGTQPLASLINVVNKGTGTGGAQYTGTSQSDASTQLFLPLVKHNYHGRTTSYYVQNTSTESTEITATFKVSSGTYSQKIFIPPLASQQFGPKDAGVPAGDTSLGSVVVTAAKPLAGVTFEHKHQRDGNEPVKTLQATKALTADLAGSKLFCPLYRHTHSNYSISSGLQVQNTEASSANVKVTFYTNKDNQPAVYGPFLKTIAGNSSGTFYAPTMAGIHNIPDDVHGSLVIESTNGKKLIAMVNEAGTEGSYKLMSTYTCFSRGSNTVYLPLAKEGYHGDTAGISIQNVSQNSTHVTLTYRSQGKPPLVLKTNSPLEAGKQVVAYKISNPSWQWNVESGNPADYDGTHGSVILTASQPIIAIVNEANDKGSSNPSGLDTKLYEGILK